MVKYFELDDCQNLKTLQLGPFEELVELSFRGCPELKELPAFEGLNCLERIVIDGCGNLGYMWIDDCRNLKSVSSNSIGIRTLYIASCPELAELPDLSRMSSLEELAISQCEKIQSIRLPTTVTSLCLQSCRDLRTVALTSARKIVTELWSIVTDSCEKLQNIEGMEELQLVPYMELVYCSNALIRNSVHKLKGLPDQMVMIGRAVGGAESSLNANLFHDANVAFDSVGDIGAQKIYFLWPEFRAVYVCFVVAVDSCSSARDINGSLDTISSICGWDKLKVREGEWVVTLAGCNYWEFGAIDQLLDILRRHGILKKGIWAGFKKDRMGKSVQVLFTIVDRLYHL